MNSLDYYVLEIGANVPNSIQKRFEVDFPQLMRKKKYKQTRFFPIKLVVGEYPTKSTENTLKLRVKPSNQDFFRENKDVYQADYILNESFDISDLNLLIELKLKEVSHKAHQYYLRISKNNLKKLQSSISGYFDSPKFKNLNKFSAFLLELTNFESRILMIDRDDFLKKEIKLFVKSKWNKNCVLIESLDMISEKAEISLLPLCGGSQKVIYLSLEWDKLSEVELIEFYYFYHSINYFISSSIQLNQASEIPDLYWSRFLDGVPFPLVLISSQGEVLFHNNIFSKLKMSGNELDSLQDRDKINIQDISYNVYCKDLNHTDGAKRLLVFFSEGIFFKESLGSPINGQDLGIICSSIAHELNNPIAGIGAALSVLLLNNELTYDEIENIQEMKKGALRCKQLIETFLGFSRLRTASNKNIQNEQGHILELCFNQALNLLRFRSVESGIRLSFEYKRISKLVNCPNISFLTMSLYLLLGEAMTQFSHQNLISESINLEKVIKGEIIESSHEINILFENVNLSGLKISKLIQNILEMEAMVPSITEHSLRLFVQPTKNVALEKLSNA